MFPMNPLVIRWFFMSLAIFSLIPSSGSRQQSIFSDYETYSAEIERMTTNMPDDVGEFLAAFWGYGFKNLASEPYFAACLASNQVELLPSYQKKLAALPWSTAKSTNDLREILLTEEFYDFATVIDSAIGICTSGDLNNLRNFLTGIAASKGVQTDAEKSAEAFRDAEEYSACINQATKILESSCSPVGEGSETTCDDFDVHCQEVQFGEESVTAGSTDQDGFIHDEKTVEYSAPGVGPPGGGEINVTTGTETWVLTGTGPMPTYEEIHAKSIFKAKVDRVFVAAAFAIVPLAIGLGPVAGLVGLGLGIAKFGVSGLLGKIDTYRKKQEWDDFVQTHKKRECTNPYAVAGMLPIDHPLADEKYSVDGVPYGPDVAYAMCECNREGVGAPITGGPGGSGFPEPLRWQCSTDAEKRQDCMANPYGLDDKPRAECLSYLYEDSGEIPPGRDQCAKMQCAQLSVSVPSENMTVRMVTSASPFGDNDCGCGLNTTVTDASGGIDACAAFMCPEGSVPSADGTGCKCQPLGDSTGCTFGPLCDGIKISCEDNPRLCGEMADFCALNPEKCLK